ncbi:hypothetical protein FRC17_007044, partial [Serendipita sp. 399]
MDQFTQLAVESTAVALFSVGVQLWRVYIPAASLVTATPVTTSTSGRTIGYQDDDMSYLYFSLAAPTLVLVHHTIYFCVRSIPSVPQLRDQTYTLLRGHQQDHDHYPSSSTAIIHKDEEGDWQDEEEEKPNSSDAKRKLRLLHPMISTVPFILLTLLLTVLLGSLALSTLIISTIDDSKYNANASGSGSSSNGLNGTLVSAFIHPCSNSSSPSSIATALAQNAIVDSNSSSSSSSLTAGAFVLQGFLSVAQTILLGLMSSVGLRARFSSQYGWTGEEDDEGEGFGGRGTEEEEEARRRVEEVYYEVVVLQA